MKNHVVIVASALLMLFLFASCNSAPASSTSSPSSASSSAASISASSGSSSTGSNSVSSGSTESGSSASSSASGSLTSAPVGDLKADSILLFKDDAGSAQLMADMQSGAIPTSCVVLYDQMGSRPAVTVEDAETITKVYNLLADIKVGSQSPYSITDNYHQIVFTLQDGSTVRFSFEGEDLLSCDRENYDVTGGGPLWSFVRSIQDEYMETHPEK